jgi:hypothetical protein
MREEATTSTSTTNTTNTAIIPTTACTTIARRATVHDIICVAEAILFIQYYVSDERAPSRERGGGRVV